MKPKPKGFGAGIRRMVVVICTVALIPGDTLRIFRRPFSAQAPAAGVRPRRFPLISSIPS